MGPHHGIFHLTNLPNADGENHGGNIEVLPPTDPPKAEEPLGAIIVGHGEEHKMSHALLQFLEAQEFQPVRKLNVDFASVHHIDEVISVGANGVIYHNDPKLALDLLREKFTTTAEKVRGCFFDAEGKGRGEHKQLGFDVADPNHTFLILDEPPDATFAAKYASGSLRTVMIGEAHGGQIARIHAFSTAVAGARPGYPASVGGKMLIEANGFWQPAKSLTPPNWNSPVLLPWGNALGTTFQTTWHQASPQGTHLLFFEGQPLYWRTELIVQSFQTLPAVLTVGELLADQAFVEFNEGYVRQNIQDVVDQLDGHPRLPLPCLFFRYANQATGAIYAYSLTPNPVNMQWSGNTAWLPKQYSASSANETDVFAEKIKQTINTEQVAACFLETWSNFHVRFGEVHCGSNVRRTPAQAWWTTIK